MPLQPRRAILAVVERSLARRPDTNAAWHQSPLALRKLLLAAAGLLIVKVAISVVIGYRRYLPPDFTSDFLLGREAYFFGPYRWAFYAHCLAGPFSLLVGTLLIGEPLRSYAPRWHRKLGRIHMIAVLFVLVPSGLWMAPYAATGVVAAIGLATLAIATAACAALGWRAAIARRFDQHQQWMWRVYVLLCSAVVIRLLGGLAAVLHWEADWYYPLSVWTSWLAPLLTFEAVARYRGRIAQVVEEKTLST